MAVHNKVCGRLSSPYSNKVSKVLYPTLEEAMNAVALQLKQGRKQHPYHCRVCDGYHLTSSVSRSASTGKPNPQAKRHGVHRSSLIGSYKFNPSPVVSIKQPGVIWNQV
jgi:hypothetical protein